jgi:hypothetical protein
MMTVEIEAPNNFFAQNYYKTLITRLYEATEYLGTMEQFNVSERTPVDTGALMADVSFEANHDPSSPLLAFIYSNTTEQQAQWGRIYEAYQEGGALGLATYTNDPHEMYAKILTDDIPAIEQWGADALQGGLDELAKGQGLL